jgi:hypothetical protein
VSVRVEPSLRVVHICELLRLHRPARCCDPCSICLPRRASAFPFLPSGEVLCWWALEWMPSSDERLRIDPIQLHSHSPPPPPPRRGADHLPLAVGQAPVPRYSDWPREASRRVRMRSHWGLRGIGWAFALLEKSADCKRGLDGQDGVRLLPRASEEPRPMGPGSFRGFACP